MKKLIAAYRKLRWVLTTYAHFCSRIATLENELRKRTEIAVDVGFPESYAIVVGRLGGRTFIQTYSVEGKSFRGLVDHLKEMERFAHVTRIDAPPNFKGVFDKEFGL